MLVGCGGNIAGNGAIFLSPGYPSYYPFNSNCVWIITVTPGLIIQLTFTTFDVEYNYICSYDYIQVSESTVVKTEK